VTFLIVCRSSIGEPLVLAEASDMEEALKLAMRADRAGHREVSIREVPS
jgi:hypothetical protein